MIDQAEAEKVYLNTTIEKLMHGVSFSPYVPPAPYPDGQDVAPKCIRAGCDRRAELQVSDGIRCCDQMQCMVAAAYFANPGAVQVPQDADAWLARVLEHAAKIESAHQHSGMRTTMIRDCALNVLLERVDFHKTEGGEIISIAELLPPGLVGKRGNWRVAFEFYPIEDNAR